MKKLRRVLAVLLVFVMSMALVTGCSGKSKQTMFSIMKDASSMNHYSYEIKVKVDSGMSGVDSMAMTLKGKTDGEAVTMGAKVTYSLYTIDIDDFFILTKDAMYINVEEIFNAFDSILSSLGVSLEDFENEFGTELKCIQFPLVDGLVNINADNSEIMDVYVTILENAFKDIKIDSNKGEYTVTVEGMEELSKLADAFITSLLDNQDAFLEQIDKNSSFDEKTLKELLNVYMNEIITALEKFNTEYELGLTEADIDELKAEAEAAAEDAAAEVQIDDLSQTYKDAFAELKDNRQDIVDEIADSADSVDGKFTMTDSLTGKEGSRVYTCEFEAELENKDTSEDLTVTVKTELTEDKDIEVKVPSSYTSVSDLMYAALVYTYENGLLDDVLGGEIDIPGLDEDIDSSFGVDASDDADVQEYDGSIILMDSWNDKSATIEFDKELIAVDTEFTSPDYGSVCFMAVDDAYCYAFMSYESDVTPVDLYTYEQENEYQDASFYTNVVYSEMTSRELESGVTIYEFDVNYNSESDVTPVHIRYFAVETGNGIIYGDINFESELTESDVLPYEQFMNAVFVNVYEN